MLAGKCFRPLSGSYISQFCDRSFVGSPSTKFPSPIGELHFSIGFTKTSKIRNSSFRPLSGSYISQSVLYFFARDDIYSFPSPIGELHFSIENIVIRVSNQKPFPSPIGELHFSILLQLHLINQLFSVSVPYRGATFLNYWHISPMKCLF